MRILISVLTFALLSPTVFSQEFVTNKPSDECLVLTVKFSWWEVNMTAVATEDGIVLIDSLYHPEAAAKARDIIKKELGDKPIKYLINTHSHPDHCFGNSVFKSAVTIGHKNCPDELKAATDSNVAFFKRMIPNMEEQVKKLETQAPEQAKVLASRLAWSKLMLALAETEGFVPPAPKLLIEDNAAVFHGGKTFKILRLGTYHSKSDLMIFIPEEKLLVLGDLYHRNNLPYLNTDLIGSAECLISVYDEIIELGDKAEYFVPGHGPVAEVGFLEKHRSYFKDLLEAIRSAKANGKTLEAAKAEITLDMYKHFGNFAQIHEANIENCWNSLAKQNEN